MLWAAALLVTGCAKPSPQAPQALAEATSPTAEAAPATTAKPALTAAKASLSPPALQSMPVRPISFDAIKFEIEKGQPFERAMLTPQIEKVLGKRIRIRGWIHPKTMQQMTGTSFVLVRDDQECCFGPGAALYDCIFVHMNPGRIARFAVDPVAVEGILSLEEILDPVDGNHLAIYRLDAEEVR